MAVEIKPTEEMMKLMEPVQEEDFGVDYTTTLKNERDHWQLVALQERAERRRLERQVKFQGLSIEQLGQRLDEAETALSAAGITPSADKTSKKSKEMN